ncbi:MAG: cell division ATP-binding protein FtsE [Methylophilaceae bacterium]|jgi:cell division transport system ATP-binding protein|tara:strand:- start:316 stop:987 length:672 start_codon:yes stop_codon:yes gene_type:complete
MIKFSNIFKSFSPANEVLQNISFEINSGELIFVTGSSGAGKSTLIKLISALEKPTSGEIIFEDQNLSDLSNIDMPYLRRKFGMIFQDHKLLFDRNCFENVALPLSINDTTSVDINRRVRAALNKVGLLDKEKVMPITLSGGEQQRLAIARAIVSRPSILIADEPTGNLDKKYADDIMNIFYSFQQVGVTVIISSHEAPQSPIKFKELHLINGELGNKDVPLLS